MTRCWIRKSGAAKAAGPFTLEELRGLEASALLTRDAEASLAAFEGFRPIFSWPELVKGLDTPGAKSISGDEAPKLGVKSGERQFVPDTAGPESLVPEEKGSSLKLGRPVFDDANAADKNAALNTMEMLRANVVAEAEPVLKFPPWHKTPLLRNGVRFALILAFGGPMIWYGGGKMELNPFLGVPLMAAGTIVVAAGFFFTFFVAPARWED